jgi:hypothetical protein
VHVVRESPPTVDLDYRDALPVGGLELRVAVDWDLAQVEAELVLRLPHDAPRRFAEVAPGRGVEDDLSYG